MPLDARITVLIQAPGEYNEHGEYTEGAGNALPSLGTRIRRGQ